MFPCAFIAFYIAHQIADHWIQTEHQAARKGGPGWPGRLACAAHVATYTVTQIVMLLVVTTFLHLSLTPWRLVAAVTVSAVTHYVADRRVPLRRLAEWAGLHDFYRLGAPRPDHDDNPCLGTGAYALDQSVHYLFLFIAALVIAA